MHSKIPLWSILKMNLVIDDHQQANDVIIYVLINQIQKEKDSLV